MPGKVCFVDYQLQATSPGQRQESGTLVRRPEMLKSWEWLIKSLAFPVSKIHALIDERGPSFYWSHSSHVQVFSDQQRFIEYRCGFAKALSQIEVQIGL